jgi:hypothetical protein
MSKKKHRLNLTIDQEIEKAVQSLKSEYGVNISAFIRLSILNHHKKLESINAEENND